MRESQMLKCYGNSGTFMIRFRNNRESMHQTKPIAWDATPREVQEALMELPTIGRVSVSFTAGDSTPACTTDVSSAGNKMMVMFITENNKLPPLSPAGSPGRLDLGVYFAGDKEGAACGEATEANIYLKKHTDCDTLGSAVYPSNGGESADHANFMQKHIKAQCTPRTAATSGAEVLRPTTTAYLTEDPAFDISGADGGSCRTTPQHGPYDPAVGDRHVSDRTVADGLKCIFKNDGPASSHLTVSGVAALCPMCNDQIPNGDETGACGGKVCDEPDSPTTFDNSESDPTFCVADLDCAAVSVTSKCRQVTKADSKWFDVHHCDCGGSCSACPTCDDGIMNGDENGVDCGGSCQCAEASGDPFRDNCGLPGICRTCTNGQIDQDDLLESGNTDSQACDSDGQPAGFCNIFLPETTDSPIPDCGGLCGFPCHCYNNKQDGDETGTDCGGSCAYPCHCMNGAKDGDEEGACEQTHSTVNPGQRDYTVSRWVNYIQTVNCDCGGSCAACPTCSDGVQNGDEEGIDCQGSCYETCATSCTDGKQNGDESDVDCGGSCPACEVRGHVDVVTADCDTSSKRCSSNRFLMCDVDADCPSGSTCDFLKFPFDRDSDSLLVSASETGGYCPDGYACYSSQCGESDLECAWDTWSPRDGGGAEWNQGFVRSDTKGGRGPFQPGQYVPCRAKSVVFWEGFHAVKGSTENLECSGRGICDYSSGACTCFGGYGSSDGEYGEGTRGDCSWEMPFGTAAGE